MPVTLNVKGELDQQWTDQSRALRDEIDAIIGKHDYVFPVIVVALAMAIEKAAASKLMAGLNDRHAPVINIVLENARVIIETLASNTDPIAIIQ